MKKSRGKVADNRPRHILISLIALFGLCGSSANCLAQSRATTGIVALYDFSNTEKNLVLDHSGFQQPLNLKIDPPRNVTLQRQLLKVKGPTTIISDGPATKIIDAVQKTGELTIEAWIKPANIKQTGPARIVTLSKNTTQRNFTLGQEGNKFDVRLRVTKTDNNGLPSLASPSKTASRRMTHVVYTRRRTGHTRMYVNGKLVSEGRASGAMEKWGKDYRLVLGNEATKDRPWLGTFHFVAIYQHALYAEEVADNYAAGAKLAAELYPNQNKANRLATKDPKAVHFETVIAPLLSAHCLECHDSPSRKGGLDLSRKALAYQGGDTGPAIVPGKPDESILWDSVASDSMPLDRTSLTANQKKLLQDWIANGATWSLDLIDPAVYIHGDNNQNWVRRLTTAEYIATVRDTLGVDIAAEARHLLPTDKRADGFSNTAYNLNVDLSHVDAYAQLAKVIVSRMDCLEFAKRFSNLRKFTDDSIGKLLNGMGEHVLRGPLEKREVIAYRGISTSVAAAGGSFADAVGLMLEAMLQSPRFIYRVEHQRGNGNSQRVTDRVLANRISYIVWGSSPDQELLDASEQGELEDDGLRQQLKRMFLDSRARDRAAQFATDWLNLHRLSDLQPNPQHYPKWTPDLADAMRAETLAFFDEVVWNQKRRMADLLNAQVTFASPALANFYGLTSPEDSDNDSPVTLSRYDLTKVSHRGGLLTQGSMLTIGGDEASMVTRGLFVMHDLLRGVVRDPPPCVDTTPIPSQPGLSQRRISEDRIANESCGGCHSRFEPLAFGLEKFDGLGAFHKTDEHGNPLREDGVVLIPGAAKPVKYRSTSELMDLLANSDRVRESLTWKLTQFALGRPLGARDAATLATIHTNSQKSGGRYEDILTEVIMSDLVQRTTTELPR